MTRGSGEHEAIRDALAQAASDLQVGRTLAAQAAEAFARTAAKIASVDHLLGKHRLSALPASDVAVSQHRMAHRPGRAPKITTDAELHAFIFSRIDRMTYTEIADEIAQHFPADRRVKKSAIHDWWKKNRKRITAIRPG